MKVLYCITRSDWGGAQAHLYGLVSEEIKKGIHCEVIVGEKGTLYDRLQALGIKVHHLSALVHAISPLQDFKAITSLCRMIKKINPEVVHLHSTKAGWIGRISSFLAGKKTIFTVHGWCFTEGLSRKRRMVGIIIEKLLANITDRIICVSDYDKNLALKYQVADSSKMITIYNGVDVQKKSLESSLIRDTSRVNVMMVARFSEPKDQETLIRALQYLDEHIHMYFVGDGPKLASVKKMVQKMNVENRVYFLGQQDDVQSLLYFADIFVLSSKYEALPISIIEAMKVGLPVIATNVGGVKELVIHGSNGFLFAVQDAEDLAVRIAQLAEDIELRKRMGLKSKHCFQANFTLDKCIEETNKVYQEFA